MNCVKLFIYISAQHSSSDTRPTVSVSYGVFHSHAVENSSFFRGFFYS